MGLWHHHRYWFNSTGGQNKAPVMQFAWRGGEWYRVAEDTAVNVSDADGNIYVQYDTSTTSHVKDVTTNSTNQNNATQIDINIAGASLFTASSTSVRGSDFDGASSGGFFHSVNDISSNIISSFALTNAPPILKLRADFNASGTSGNLTVFLSYKTKP